MTTFHDPQPQSRRVARQSERTEGAESTVGFTQFPSTEQPTPPPVYNDTTHQAEMWDTISRRAAQLPPASPRSDEPVTTGRRAVVQAPQAAAQPEPTAEPLTYTTQSRAVPQYEAPAPSMRPRGQRDQPATLDSGALPPTQAIPQTEQPAYRVRDFSPGTPRFAPPATDSSTATAAWQQAQPAQTDLQYHTQNRAGGSAAFAEAPEQTLSRREMRAMLHAEGEASAEAAVLASGQSAPVQHPSEPVAPVEPPAQQAPVQQAPFEQQPVQPEPVQPELVQPEPVQQQVAVEQPVLQASVQHAPVSQSPATEVDSQAESVFPFSLTDPDPASSLGRAPEPTTNTDLNNAISEFDRLTAPAQDSGQVQPVDQQAAPVAEPEPVSEPAAQPDPVAQRAPEPGTGVWTPPVGHWSTQADPNDENELYDNTLNRTIGTGAATTSALVLPVVPAGSDIRGALTGTGEIMLTGSIDLPHSYSSTGASDRFEHGGIDSLFDMNDADVVSTDSAPVRAIRAVSTHNTSGHGVTHTQRPKGTRALTALLIAASSMAVVVAGLLIAAFAFNVF